MKGWRGMIEASAARSRVKTHCPAGHPYTAENTIRTTRGWRRCRACENERQYHRKLAAAGVAIPRMETVA